VLEHLDALPQEDKEALAGLADLVRVVHAREPAPVALDGGRALGLDEGALDAEQRVVVLLGAARLREVDRQDRVGEVGGDEEDACAAVVRLGALLRGGEVGRRGTCGDGRAG